MNFGGQYTLALFDFPSMRCWEFYFRNCEWMAFFIQNLTKFAYQYCTTDQKGYSDFRLDPNLDRHFKQIILNKYLKHWSQTHVGAFFHFLAEGSLSTPV